MSVIYVVIAYKLRQIKPTQLAFGRTILLTYLLIYSSVALSDTLALSLHLQSFTGVLLDALATRLALDGAAPVELAGTLPAPGVEPRVITSSTAHGLAAVGPGVQRPVTPSTAGTQ